MEVKDNRASQSCGHKVLLSNIGIKSNYGGNEQEYE